MPKMVPATWMYVLALSVVHDPPRWVRSVTATGRFSQSWVTEANTPSGSKQAMRFYRVALI